MRSAGREENRTNSVNFFEINARPRFGKAMEGHRESFLCRYEKNGGAVLESSAVNDIETTRLPGRKKDTSAGQSCGYSFFDRYNMSSSSLQQSV